MAAPLTPAARARREQELLDHVRQVPGLTANELARAVLRRDYRGSGATALRPLVRLERAGLVRCEREPASGPAKFKRVWYPA
jgi:DNA-binding transcriptional ArsR family regulator